MIQAARQVKGRSLPRSCVHQLCCFHACQTSSRKGIYVNAEEVKGSDLRMGYAHHAYTKQKMQVVYLASKGYPRPLYDQKTNSHTKQYQQQPINHTRLYPRDQPALRKLVASLFPLVGTLRFLLEERSETKRRGRFPVAHLCNVLSPPQTLCLLSNQCPPVQCLVTP